MVYVHKPFLHIIFPLTFPTNHLSSYVSFPYVFLFCILVPITSPVLSIFCSFLLSFFPPSSLFFLGCDYGLVLGFVLALLFLSQKKSIGYWFKKSALLLPLCYSTTIIRNHALTYST